MRDIDRWHEDEFRRLTTEKVLQLLDGTPTEATLAAAVSGCAEDAEAICSDRPMACAAGCPYCCVLNVAILLPEAMFIAQRLVEQTPQRELDELRKRLGQHRSWTRWMDDEERILKRMSCPLLDQYGACDVHPVRPLACRAITSLDSECCREAFAPVVSDEDRLVPTDLLRKAAYDAAFTSLAAGLHSCGLDDRSIELGTGVIAFLEHPEYRELFLNGGKLPDALWR
ncbi:YkgJ family cysteine cluster protein [Geomonas edaphica]|uniref:YkgJ family cysteine cluster protein n=1 Tax=Geomonas edaphica TaxID=2570226 RepID=UPI0010A918DD|nr:YkgJ family cysteine cluster protein [Geomonas edaphica]